MRTAVRGTIRSNKEEVISTTSLLGGGDRLLNFDSRGRTPVPMLMPHHAPSRTPGAIL
ncbi:unnamed protein product, partial [Trichogramma brassicae]